MDRNSYHVIAKVDGGWKVTRRDASRATRTFGTQKEAIRFARNISRSRHAELFIHDINGRLQERKSYSTDAVLVKE